MLEPLRHGPLYRTGNLDRRVAGRVRRMERARGFLRGWDAARQTSRARPCSSSRARSSPNRTPLAGSSGADTGSMAADVSTSCTCPKRTTAFPAGLNGRFHGLLADRAPRHGDALQRPVRHPPRLLPPRQRRLLLRRRSQSHPCRAAGDAGARTSAGWVSSSRAAPSSRTGRSSRTFTCCPAAPPGCSATASSSERAATSTRGSGRSRRSSNRKPTRARLRTVFSRNLPRYFEARAARRHVAHRRHGHPDDHGLAQGPSGIAALLHVRGHVPRLSGRRRGAPGRRAPAGSRTKSSASAKSSCAVSRDTPSAPCTSRTDAPTSHALRISTSTKGLARSPRSG